MALVSANVRVGITGALWCGAVGSQAPTDAEAEPDTAFGDLGYFSEDGVTETRDRSTNEIRAWQNADLVREVVTESSLSFQGTMIETRKESVELFYGSTVDNTGRLVIVPAKTGGRKAFILDVVDGDEYIRYYIPQGEITEVGDVQYVHGDPIGYQVTVKCYPDPEIPDENGDPGTAVRWQASLAGS